ncbi:MAG TPA: Holliday junction resolvase Hjc [Candidatus Nanoarchaeia archaeon]|nr:Holliday junction resolvase Hjc [Candidatus Nanoarchaeia archaeon]
MSKVKGSRTERELVQLFNKREDWAAIRVAGSGLTKEPNPDVLAGSEKRKLAIECKSVKGTIRYLYQEDADQIIKFAEKFGAEAWFGIRFNNKGWFFLKPHQLEKTKNSNLSISLKLAEEIGIKFEVLAKNE